MSACHRALGGEGSHECGGGHAAQREDARHSLSQDLESGGHEPQREDDEDPPVVEDHGTDDEPRCEEGALLIEQDVDLHRLLHLVVCLTTDHTAPDGLRRR